MWATWGLIALCMVVFAFAQPKPFQGLVHGLDLTSNARAELQMEHFADRYALVPCELTHGKSLHDGAACGGYPTDRPENYASKNVYLPLLTLMFLHGGLTHILGNMLFLWVFGRGVEQRLGGVAVLALFLAGGLAASLGFVAFHPESTEPMLGASGAIAALMGAYLVLLPQRRILSMVYSAGLQFVYLPAWAVLAFFFTEQFFVASSQGIAWEAHVCGMVFGAVVAALIVRRDPTMRDHRAPPSVTEPFPAAVVEAAATWPTSPPRTPPSFSS